MVSIGPTRPIGRTRRGFTLVEAAIVLVIIGLGVTGLVQLIAAGSMANNDTTELTTAVELANNINEMMQGAYYPAIKSTWDDQSYSPPRDALGNTLTAFTGWAQNIDVKYVDPNYLVSTVPDTQVEAAMRVTVTVSRHGSVVHTAKWLILRPS